MTNEEVRKKLIADLRKYLAGDAIQSTLEDEDSANENLGAVLDRLIELVRLETKGTLRDVIATTTKIGLYFDEDVRLYFLGDILGVESDVEGGRENIYEALRELGETLDEGYEKILGFS